MRGTQSRGGRIGLSRDRPPDGTLDHQLRSFLLLEFEVFREDRERGDVEGAPDIIGSSGVAQALRHWLGAAGVGTLYIEPGSPWENGYAESFHGRFRDEFLAMEIFDSIRDARSLTAAWRDQYNAHRPHSSLGYLTPARFAAACAPSASAKASAPAAHAGAKVQPGS